MRMIIRLVLAYVCMNVHANAQERIPLDWVSTGVAAPGSGTIRLLVTITQAGVNVSVARPEAPSVTFMQPARFVFERAERVRAASVGTVWCVDRSAQRIVVAAYAYKESMSTQVVYLPVSAPEMLVSRNATCATSIAVNSEFDHIDVLVSEKVQ